MVQKFLLAALLILLFAPISTFAQHKGQTTEEEINLNSTHLFPRHYYTLRFMSDPRQSESEFTMRLQAYGVVSGCAEMEKGRVEKELRKRYAEAIKNGYQISYLGKRIRIEILDNDVKVNKKKHPDRYSPHDCNIKHLISYTDVKLDRDKLLKQKAEKIQFESVKYGDFGEYDIDVNEDRFILKVNTGGSEVWYHFWFFPSNSIVLKATAAKQGENVTELIREFGISHGLIPMEDVLDGYKLPHTAMSHVFFTDPTGKFINRLNNENQNAFVGKIKPTRTVYGVDGPREEAYGIDLHASFAVQEQPE